MINNLVANLKTATDHLAFLMDFKLRVVCLLVLAARRPDCWRALCRLAKTMKSAKKTSINLNYPSEILISAMEINRVFAHALFGKKDFLAGFAYIKGVEAGS